MQIAENWGDVLGSSESFLYYYGSHAFNVYNRVNACVNIFNRALTRY